MPTKEKGILWPIGKEKNHAAMCDVPYVLHIVGAAIPRIDKKRNIFWVIIKKST